MPTYEYECRKCGKTFEVFQKMTDAPVKKCVSCKGAVRRLIGTGGGVIYKGGGFYTTEYRSEEYKRKAREEKSGSTCPASSTPSPAPCAAGASGSSCACKSGSCPKE